MNGTYNDQADDVVHKPSANPKDADHEEARDEHRLRMVNVGQTPTLSRDQTLPMIACVTRATHQKQEGPKGEIECGEHPLDDIGVFLKFDANLHRRNGVDVNPMSGTEHVEKKTTHSIETDDHGARVERIDEHGEAHHDEHDRPPQLARRR